MNGPKRGLIGVVIVLIFVLLSLSVSAEQGCYYFPDSEFYCQQIDSTVAQRDCQSQGAACANYIQYFTSGISCNDPRISACQAGFCRNTCEPGTPGECGVNNFYSPAEAEDACTPGCCRFIAPSVDRCDYYPTRAECEQLARVLGGDRSQITLWDTRVDQDACLTNTCRGVAQGNAAVTATVVDQNRQPIVGADVVIGVNRCRTGDAGSCQLSNLPAGLVEVTASSAGFTGRTSVTLRDHQNTPVTVTINTGAPRYTLSGIITGPREEGGANVPLSGVQVRLTPQGYDETDGAGQYTIRDLPAGTYTITAIKPGYQGGPRTITLDRDTRVDFTFTLLPFQGIRGTVTNAETNEPVPSAFISINNQLRTTTDANGRYQVYLSRLGSYQVSATHPRYEPSELQTATITQRSLVAEVPIALTLRIGECAFNGPTPQKPVEVFTFQHVRGTNEIQLRWQKPCREVLGYELKIFEGDNEEAVNTLEPPVTADHYLHQGVRWNIPYRYEIRAIYTDGNYRLSDPAAVLEVTTGNAECAGRTEAKDFCLFREPSREGFPEDAAAADLRKLVFFCTPENQLAVRPPCGLEHSFCVEQDSGAFCSENNECTSTAQEANPLGLYFTKEQCYGEDNTNACYYDYTTTQSNQCKECTTVKSCFDYQSRDACQTNQCLGYQQCEWLEGAAELVSLDNLLGTLPINREFITALRQTPNLIFTETGHGYCAEKERQPPEELQTLGVGNSCALCSADLPPSSLFENYLCTPTICRNLGECYASPQLTECTECKGTTTCYNFKSELECTNGPPGQPLTIQNGLVTASDDTCSLDRCRWTENGCVKDGNGDGDDDCDGDTTCQKDNKPPVTTITTPPPYQITLTTPSLTFQATDNKNTFHYCLSPTPNECSPELNAPLTYDYGRSTVMLPIADLLLQSGTMVDGVMYYLRYYSTDIYKNQESANQQPLFIDITPPRIQQIPPQVNTVEGKTTINVAFETSEFATCTTTLTRLNPALTPEEAPEVRPFERGRQMTDSFLNLEGLRFQLDIRCEDDYHNPSSVSEIINLDVVGQIEVVSPKGFIHETTVPVSVKTLVNANCQLYDSSNYLMDMTTADYKTHTAEITGLIHGQYGNYNVVCTDFSPDPIRFGPAYLFFTVDFLPPRTSALIQEGENHVSKSGSFPWDEFFVNRAVVTLNCEAEGFPCAKTEFRQLRGNYQEYQGPFAIEDTTTICYRSHDEAGNVEAPICGTIHVDGFGLQLLSPPNYRFANRWYAVTNRPTVNLELSTAVAATSCKWDFRRDFNYEQLVDPGKQFQKREAHFFRQNFPRDYSRTLDADESLSIFIRCQDASGLISDPQEFLIEYDPTAPQIEQALARPELVTSSNSVELTVRTDDKTFCRFDQRPVPYVRMSGAFPDDQRELHHEHHLNVPLSARDDRRTHTYYISCANGAGTVSQTVPVRFQVDFSRAGTITETAPTGLITENDITLHARTNTFGMCSYRPEADEALLPFAVTGEDAHTQPLGQLEDGPYNYLLQCQLGSHAVEGDISFTVDTTPPTITDIAVDPVFCSLNYLTAQVHASETVSQYDYEVYQNGPPDTLVAEGTILADQPWEVSLPLEENTLYSFRVRVVDEAGHVSPFETSGPIQALSPAAEECQQDQRPPEGGLQLGGPPEEMDSDGDTIPDEEDNCIDVFNLRQEDSDGDGQGDACDADSNDNGVADFFEQEPAPGYVLPPGVAAPSRVVAGGPTRIPGEVVLPPVAPVLPPLPGDADGDGVSDIADNCPSLANADQRDLDNDRLGDVCDLDLDGDGILNAQDRDRDGDGADDALDDDLDNDGIPNNRDPDANGDGVPDVPRPSPVIGTLTDIDGDGIPNESDADIDGDGTRNSNDRDVDGDGQDNLVDQDDDQDGIADDSDQTPLGRGTATDADGDSIPDATDNCPLLSNSSQHNMDLDEFGDLCDRDMDGDGIANIHDRDRDGDGIDDALDDDLDNDGIPNDRDDDIDGDGLPNATDRDVDGDGRENVIDPDIDGDGVVNSADSDLDGDRLLNNDDPDSDGDGLLNADDPTPNGTGTPEDLDGDSIPNGEDLDINGNTIPNPEDPDMDGDGIPNGADLDIDQDGVPNADDPDVDGDRIPNNRDVDIDSDGIANVFDSDIDGDQVENNRDPDNDADRILNEFDTTPNGIGTPADIDDDGIPNGQDIDVDGDGKENVQDTDIDGDGVANGIDPDMDSDGNLNTTDNDVDGDSVPNTNDSDIDSDGVVNVSDTDSDGDGVPNAQDTDDDNDGIPDTIDTTPNGKGTAGDVDGDGVPNDRDEDINGDGKENTTDADMDGDGTTNLKDTDRDGDGIPNREDKKPSGPAAPRLDVSKETSCRATVAQLFCTDSSGCRKILYGTAFERDKCQPTAVYNGQRLFVNRAQWLCFYMEDTLGNSATSASEISFADKDGDQIADSCDQCGNTVFNAPVDNVGCALRQVTDADAIIDTDRDGLPDYWEEKYSSANCVFDKTKEDGNNNHIEDNREDYDNDGYSNYMEFVLETNPCEVSVVDTDGDGIPNTVDQCIDTAEDERDDVDRDTDSSTYGCSREENRDIDEFGQPVESEDRLSVGREEPAGVDITTFVEETSTLAWGFIIAGMLLLLGGSGYLLVKRFKPPRRKGESFIPVSRPLPREVPPTATQKQAIVRRLEQERSTKAKQRGLLFGEFTPSSATIPHVEPLLKKSGDPHEKLAHLLHLYDPKKETIKPGLRPAEKDVFDKLEKLTRKVSQGQSVERVVSKEEAQSLFERLDKLVKQRKKK